MLQDQEEIEPEFAGFADILSSSLAQASDVAHSLQLYLRQDDVDPQQLRELDARISLWMTLARRYKRPPAELPELLRGWKSELTQLDAASDLQRLEAAEAASAKAYQASARALSVGRAKAAPKLSQAISEAMQDLGMQGGRFEVSIARAAEPSSHGVDEVMFLVAGAVYLGMSLGGAALGAALTGPLAPLGAVVGYVLVDRYVGERARAEVRQQLRRGLAQAASVPLLPERAELLPGHARSAITLGFCGPVKIGPGVGISTRLALRSPAPGGAVVRGVVLPEPDPSDMSDVRLDLSIDAVNTLLHAWTASGLLAERMAAAQWTEQVDRALQEWTLLSLAGVTLTRAPVVMAADQGSAAPGGDAWALSFGGLALDLRGGEHTGTLVAAGRGWIRPAFDAGSGRLELGGAVDRLRLTCIEGQVLAPCFGALLELGEVEARLDESLSPGTGRLPGIDVRGLLRTRTRALRPEGLDVEALTVTVPPRHPAVLRVRARLRR